MGQTLRLTQAEQLHYDINQVRAIIQAEFEQTGRSASFRIQTYGCQQNVSDSEKLQGILYEMGYSAAGGQQDPDLVILNTCAVREHAEDRVLGNIGALKHAKRRNPDMTLIVCGCMSQQPHIAEQIYKRYPFVDIVFGAGAMDQLPALLLRKLNREKRHVALRDPTFAIQENLPIRRDGAVKAWLPVMYGCNNFCSFCVVPLVRGRERSRDPDNIVAEARKLVVDGYKEITLLGQNVNSYGKTLADPIDFSALLHRICTEVPGDYWIRFMTSHPKDCTPKLIDTIAAHPQICSHLHLPVQSGSDRILKEMNRHYTLAHYKELIAYAKRKIPGMTFTSDIIVGFPGETEAEFEQTLELVQDIGYQSLFTFVFSRRSGTKAYDLPDPTPKAEKSARMQRLLDVQGSIGQAQYDQYVGKTLRVLVDGQGKTGEDFFCGRSESNIIVEFPGVHTDIGSFVEVRVQSAKSWALLGEKIER